MPLDLGVQASLPARRQLGSAAEGERAYRPVHSPREVLQAKSTRAPAV